MRPVIDPAGNRGTVSKCHFNLFSLSLSTNNHPQFLILNLMFFLCATLGTVKKPLLKHLPFLIYGCPFSLQSKKFSLHVSVVKPEWRSSCVVI